ncbi:MAG: ribonuclease HII [Methanosphaera sp.]|nr:ribonuclease HII [Methanosphaera sp.]
MQQDKRIVLGIDEAGRGSVIGPLVVGAIAMEKRKIHHLKRMGVKDSKKVTSKTRTVLSRKLKKTTQFKTVIIPPEKIDQLRNNNMNLNEIETNAMKEIIKEVNPDICYVDCIDVDEKRFHDILQEVNPDIEIITEHKADDTYEIVSAASIIAKVERDKQIAIIQSEYGDVGSGYPSDEKTINYLKSIDDDNYPPIIRKTWKTFQNILKERNNIN